MQLGMEIDFSAVFQNVWLPPFPCAPNALGNPAGQWQWDRKQLLHPVAQVWSLGQWCPAPKCNWALTHSWPSCPSGWALPALGPNPAKGICTSLCKINPNPHSLMWDRPGTGACWCFLSPSGLNYLLLFPIPIHSRAVSVLRAC